MWNCDRKGSRIHSSAYEVTSRRNRPRQKGDDRRCKTGVYIYLKIEECVLSHIDKGLRAIGKSLDGRFNRTCRCAPIRFSWPLDYYRSFSYTRHKRTRSWPLNNVLQIVFLSCICCLAIEGSPRKPWLVHPLRPIHNPHFTILLIADEVNMISKTRY